MKKYSLLLMLALLTIGCQGQENKTTTEKSKTNKTQTPKGNWKVHKKIDEHGNLIQYDSIYSWSSDGKFDNLSSLEKDSLMQSFKSKFFTNFSMFEAEGFENIFTQDSLFSKRFFNDTFFESSFGKDFIDIDKLHQQMMERQHKFLEKYQSEFMKSEEKDK